MAGPVAEAGAEAVAGVVAEAVAGDDVVADDVPDSSIVYFFSESSYCSFGRRVECLGLGEERDELL